MSEAKGIWKWINETKPGLTWKKYKCNYWGTWYRGHHLELWPTKVKFRYKGVITHGPRGYRNLIREEEGLDMAYPLKVGAEAVNNPDHYNKNGIECIAAIEASLTEEEFQGYLKGNSMKYLWRYRYKGKPKEDLDKADWYLRKLREKT